MFTHPDLVAEQARLREQYLIEEAERFRLLRGVHHRQHGLPGPVRRRGRR